MAESQLYNKLDPGKKQKVTNIWIEKDSFKPGSKIDWKMPSRNILEWSW